jgi:hypothetical protein
VQTNGKCRPIVPNKSKHANAIFKRNSDFSCAFAAQTIGGWRMDQGEELATAGLVVTFAAVLLVSSHRFIDFKAKQLVTQPRGERVAMIRR